MINDNQTADIFDKPFDIEALANEAIEHNARLISERDDLQAEINELRGVQRGYTENAEGAGMFALTSLYSPKWLIDGIMPARGLHSMFAESGAGKSFTAIAIAMSVSTGRPFAGLPVKKAKVAYIVTEGRSGFRNRCMGWIQHFGISEADAPTQTLMIIGEKGSVKLDNEPQARRILTTLEAYRPDLLIIDTWTQVFSGDENKQIDVMKLNSVLQTFEKKLGCAVLVIDHTGHNNTDRARGSKCKFDVADGVISLTGKVGEDAGVITLSCDKARDTANFKPVKLQANVINLKELDGSEGKDMFGRPVTTIVMDTADPAAAAKADKAVKQVWGKLSEVEQGFLMLLDKPLGANEWADWRSTNIWVNGGSTADRSRSSRFLSKLNYKLGLVYADAEGVMTLTDKGRTVLDLNTWERCDG